LSGARLADRAVVITGAGGGIGRAIARSFAAEGAAVVVCDVGPSADETAATLRAAGARAIGVTADVTDLAAMERLMATAAGELGGVDVLVTCAGLGTSGLLVDQDPKAWLHVIDVNLNGTYRAIRAALPSMIAKGVGRIVTIASVFGRVGGSGFVTAYVASKHGVIGLTRALASELGSQGHHGITVNAVCPGYVRAGMGIAPQSTKAGPMPGEAIFERYYKRQVPLRRMIEADEIAAAAVFLALPESGGITGQALNVDGGFVMS
jgi:NAD(P)-dependent dehydrogenase (short-subunit alcohol dehydrogenase family)